MEKSEIPLVHFTGKNYPPWAFQFQIYPEGKEMWGHITGSDPKPTEDVKQISSCQNQHLDHWISGTSPYFESKTPTK